MSRTEMMEFASNMFEAQMGLQLSDILDIENNKFSITSDNKMGLSIASLQLEMSAEEHGQMGDFLTAVSEDAA